MKSEIAPEVRRYMSELGKSTSEAKRLAAIANSAKTRFKLKALKEIPCTCGGGEVFTPEAHPTTCPRGRAIRYRLKKGLVLR